MKCYAVDASKKFQGPREQIQNINEIILKILENFVGEILNSCKIKNIDKCYALKARRNTKFKGALKKNLSSNLAKNS